MVSPVGYLLSSSPGIGSRTSYYDYVFAGNGVFVQAEGNHLSGRATVAEACIRGLPDLHPVLELKHGRIPAPLLDLAAGIMMAQSEREVYVGIGWRDWSARYKLYLPEQEGTPGRVQYACGQDIVLDLHSHPGMRARFSGTDDRDEQSLRLYGVVGWEHGGRSEIALRLGVYGYWCPLELHDVFQGDVSAWERSGDVPAV